MIAIVFALEFESAYFRAHHDSRLKVATWLLGAMGKNTAPVLAKKLEEVRPDLVISAGFAGGLQPQVKIGDLVLGGNYSDESLVGLLNLGADWHVGPILTEFAIIEKMADKRRLGEASGALAGDLETSHLAEVCSSKGIPMLAVRCISDALADDMPVPANVLMNPKDGRPAPMQLFQYLLKNPASVAGFNRLVKNARTAQRQLASGLEEILPQLLKAL